MRISHYLSENNLANTYLIDYEQGYMAKSMDKRLSTLLVYQDTSKVQIPEDGILVLQSMTPWSIFPGLEVNPNTKVLFWSCYPFGLIPLMPGIRTLMQSTPWFAKLLLNTFLLSFTSKMQAFVMHIQNNKGLVFQDKANVKITKDYLNVDIQEPKFLTIPSVTSERKKEDSSAFMKRNKSLRVTWIGRIVDMKFFILKKAIEEMSTLNKDLNYNILFNIIGSGNYLEKLKRFCLKKKNLHFNFIDHIHSSKIDDFLISETDLLFAMGTSALEGAKLGLPTILMDISFKEVPKGYKFTWLHERKDNAIADIVDDEHIELDNNSLRIHIDELLNNFQKISNREHEYFTKNHSLENVSKTLLKHCGLTELSWDSLDKKGFLKKNISYKIFLKIREGIIKK